MKGEERSPEERLTLRPVFLAMFSGVLVVALTQFIIHALGGIAVGPFQRLGIWEWVLLFFLLALVFLIYLGPATLLIRFIIYRLTGVRAPLFRTAMTFLSSFVLLACALVLLSLFLSGASISLRSLDEGVLTLLVIAYITLGSYLASLWFIAENKAEEETESEEETKKEEKGKDEKAEKEETEIEEDKTESEEKE